MKDQQAVLFVKFKSDLSDDELMEVAQERIDRFKPLEGLIQKYYCRDPATGEYVGIYIWDSPAKLEKYRKSELCASIAEAYKVIGEPKVEVLEIVELLR
jgi:quinol monooxygenase YgiN